MSSTNKTTHYNLSQYVSTDKPTYLVDYNADMSAIDSGIYAAKSEADTNTTSIGTLSNLTTTEKTNLVGAINEVDGNVDTLSGTVSGHTTAIADNTSDIGNLANLETTNKNNLVSAVNEVNGHIDVLNINTFTTYEASDLQITGGTIQAGSLTVARNSDGSICKVYGTLAIAKTNQSATITIPNSGLAPSSEFTVYPSGFEMNNTQYGISSTSTIFKTNGNIEITSYGTPAGVGATCILFPIVIFVKDFGDTPNL